MQSSDIKRATMSRSPVQHANRYRNFTDWLSKSPHSFFWLFKYALLIYDKKQQEIHLHRDQFGIKPLYYSIQNKELLVSSSLACFSHCPLSPSGLLTLKKWGQNLQQSTLHAHVLQFPKGQLAVFDSRQGTSNFNTTALTAFTPVKAPRALFAAIKSSVKERAASSYPTNFQWKRRG